MYNISNYSYRQAKRLNVIIKPSRLKNKKIDVYDKYGNKLATIGDKRYNDYPTYLKTYGKQYADYRRKLYKLRHRNDRFKKGSAGFYADQILW